MHHTRRLPVRPLLGAILIATGCSGPAATPASPSAALPPVEDAAPDGATLKVTPPEPSSPTGGATIDTERPTLTATAAKARFEGTDMSAVRYRFHLLRDDGRSVGDAVVAATAWAVPWELEYETTYRWRVRAEADGAFSAWSSTASFRTLDDPGGLPRGPYPSSGPAVAAWVEQRWPELLQARTSMSRRTHNMEFLRDRMIEAARCGGLDVAWNKKRGTGPHSHDALAWRVGGRVEVVDIALAFKDPSKPLRLHWNITAGPPGYDRYTAKFRCRP